MKELSIEEKAQKYDEAFRIAQELYNNPNSSNIGKGYVCTIFPKLKESEDEKIRKELIEHCKNQAKPYIQTGNKCPQIQSWIAWLEKQGQPTDINPSEFDLRLNRLLKEFESLPKEELTSSLSFYLNAVQNNGTYVEEKQDEQNPATDKVEPKFHEGEWVILTAGELSTTLQIVKVDTNKRLYWFNDSSYLPIVDEECLQLWTIQDAKDGDVLAFYSEYRGNKMVQVGIIEKYVGKHGGCSNTFKIYVGVNWDNNLQIGEYMGCSDIRPATKEQRDALMKAMTDAGYTFDFEKKELKKIEKKPQCIVSVEAKEAMYDKTAWSKEDEKMLEYALDMIEWYGGKNADKSRLVSDWLKSIRPQKQWKPSEEMLEALYRVIPENVMEKSEDEILLDKLYQGLKYGRVLSKN